MIKNSKPVVSCEHLCKYFPVLGGFLRRELGAVKAVDDVSFTIDQKEIVGVIGESGSGKSTLARTIMRLTNVTSGQIFFDDTDITHMSQDELRLLRKSFQIVFQNPSSSLNARKTVLETLSEVILFHEMADDVIDYSEYLLKKVGLDPAYLSRYPHELSIGQQQRLCIARALCTKPKLLVLDECVSALDISVQAQVLNLLLELYEEQNLSYLFISHDIGVVEHLSDKILVMYQGKVIEQGTTEAILRNPQKEYTKLLLSAELPITTLALPSG